METHLPEISIMVFFGTYCRHDDQEAEEGKKNKKKVSGEIWKESIVIRGSERGAGERVS